MRETAAAPRGTKERLQQISHHFLSSAPAPGSGGKGPLMVPVFMIGERDSFPCNDLARALLARGRAVQVLDVERDVQEPSPPDPSQAPHHERSVPPGDDAGGNGPARAMGVADLGEIVAGVRALKPPPELCLVPLRAVDWPLASFFGSVLLAVPTSREGVTEAYRFAKRAATAGGIASVGVTMVGASDPDSAALHFAKLAEGVVRFLGVEVASYGYVPAPPAPHAAVNLLSSRGWGDEAAEAVAGIANLIVADLPAPPPVDRKAEPARSVASK